MAATDLSDLVDPLKREVAAPGRFAATFPSSTDDDLIGYLADAFAAAQIDGFFGDQVLDPDASTVTQPLSPAGRQLVVIYAAQRITTNRILDLRQRVAYEAGPVKYETENSAQMLTTVLKELSARRATIVAAATAARSSGGFFMQDMYADRSIGFAVAGSFYAYEL